jgi:hypothetical protein
MAFPTIRSSNSGEASLALSATITLPTGHTEGDLLIIGLSLDGSRTCTAPDGWSLLADPSNTSANRFPIWYKVRGSSESNPTITWETTSEQGTWFSIAITKDTYQGVPEINTIYGSSNIPNAPALYPTWGTQDTLWFAFHGWDYNRTSTSNPTDFTLLTYNAGSSTSSAGHRTHYRSVNAEFQDPSNITISSTDTWYAHTVAISPYIEPQKGIYGNIGDSWKVGTSVAVNIGGVWKNEAEMFMKIDGVWKSIFSLIKTTAPTITTGSYVYSGGTYTVNWTVRNNENASSTILTEINDPAPDAYSRTLAYNATWDFSENVGSFFGGATIYATAKTSGKATSNFHSYYVSS